MTAPVPAEPLLRLRPLGLGEVLDDVFRVYRRHFWMLLAIALLLSVPGLVLQLASGSADQFGFAVSLLGSLGNPTAPALREPPPAPNLVLVLLGDLVMIVMLPFTIGAISQAAIDLVQGAPATIRSSLRAVLRRYWGLLGQAALLLLLTPLFVCLPLVIWIGVRWAVAVPALLAEGIGPIRALGRSWALTQGHFWRLFAILIVITLLEWVVSGSLGFLGFPIALLIPFIAPSVRGAIILTAGTVAQAVVLPALYLCLVLLYFDLRIRMEHFDLDQLARQAAGPPP